ncbi:MAG: hypothetical protein CMG00_01415 [Candidatus Marinimicrobia bacterium]|nr:hypothetical protein [Candidatus Neomarinimicrobiota bacterium]
MKIFFFIFFIFFSCNSKSNVSFESLSEAFIVWYYRNNPVKSTQRNLDQYDDSYKLNDYKSNDKYLSDLNRFYFELSQINPEKLIAYNKFQYDQLYRFIVKELYLYENIRYRDWRPSFKLREIRNGIEFLVDYNYKSMEGKMSSLEGRLELINKILDYSIINLSYLSDDEYARCINVIDDILIVLKNIDISIDYRIENYENIIDNVFNVSQRFDLYKNELRDIKNEFSDIDYIEKFNINDESYSIMAQTNVSIDDLYVGASNNLRINQIDLFNLSLPFFLIDNDEPVWVDYDDTLNVINSVIDSIKNKNKIKKLSYIENSYNENIDRHLDVDINFLFFTTTTDFSYFDEDAYMVVPFNKYKIEYNLPKLDLKFALKAHDYNYIQIDLLNAFNLYPGKIHAIYKTYNHVIPYNFPNETTIKGLQRYSEKVFIQKNNSSIAHSIIHRKNIIQDICKCLADIYFNVDGFTSGDIMDFFDYNCFFSDIEQNNILERLKDSHFSDLSKNYIGFSKILELEELYFQSNNQDYMDFYNWLLQYGIIDLDNFLPAS